MASASADKWRYTFYTTFVLLILFNPWTYNLVDSLFYRLIVHYCLKPLPAQPHWSKMDCFIKFLLY